MIGTALITKYKKITKEIMDKNKTGMDYDLIEGFEYPALFKYQKYFLDDAENVITYVLDDKGVFGRGIKEREEYIKYYGE
jgi:hypothetical protein